MGYGYSPNISHLEVGCNPFANHLLNFWDILVGTLLINQPAGNTYYCSSWTNKNEEFSISTAFALNFWIILYKSSAPHYGKKDPSKPAPWRRYLTMNQNVWTFNLFIPNKICQPQTIYSKVSHFLTATIHGFPSSWGWPHPNHQPIARPRCQCSIYIVSTSHRTLWSVHGCKISNMPQPEVANFHKKV